MLVVALSFLNSPGVDTEAQALQVAADFVASLDGPVIFDWSQGPGDGVWDLDRSVVLQMPEGAHVRPGSVRVEPGTTLESALFISGRSTTWDGYVRVTGTGSAVYEQRTVTDLVWLGDVSYARFDGFDLKQARRDCLAGFPSGSNLISTDLGSIRVRDCGSAALPGHVSTVELDYTARVDTGGPTSVAQRTSLTIPDGVDGAIALGALVYHEDRVHYVYSAGPTSLEVYPQLAGAAATGQLVSAHGAGVKLRGGNTTGNRGMLDCIRAGVCLADSGLYGGTWSVVAQASGVGLQIGANPGAAHLRGWYTGHFELPATRRSGVKVQRPALTGAMLGGLLRTPLGSTRWVGLTPSGNATWDGWDGAVFLHGGHAVDGAEVVYTP